MPIKPRPFTFVCEDCKWKKTIAPRSDALMPATGSRVVRNAEAQP